MSLGGFVVSIPGGVVITGSNTGEARVIPTLPSILGAGTHTDTITIRACTTDLNCTSGQLSGSPPPVAVTYNINGIKAQTNSLDFSINDASTPADISKVWNLSGYPANMNFTVAAVAPWLTLPSQGAITNGSGQLAVALNQSEIDKLSDGQYGAGVILTPQAGEPINVQVILQLNRTRVISVSPYVATAGSSHEVVIRGSHLPAGRTVMFGNTSRLRYVM